MLPSSMTAPMRLEGKRVFVTAAAQGIGRAIAEACAAEGAHVVATDLDGDKLAGLDADCRALDVTDKAALTAAVDGAAPDVLCNCAGFVHAGTLLDVTDADLDFAWTLNLRAMLHAAQAAVPGMVERGGGSIINMSSVASSILGTPNRCIYNTTKAAVIGLTKSIAGDFIKQGIRCNAICPGTVDSPSLHQRMRDTGDYEAAMSGFVARQPMGRMGQPVEIAALAVYLASDASAYMTGQTLAIDGGMTL